MVQGIGPRKERGRPKAEIPHTVDVHVGGRIRLRRGLMGISQGKLAEQLGLTFQQVQKYERGTNRVSSSRLWELGNALGVPIAYFFDGLEVDRPASGNVDQPSPWDPVHDRTTATLIRDFRQIPSSDTRKAVASVIQAIAASATPSAADVPA